MSKKPDFNWVVGYVTEGQTFEDVTVEKFTTYEGALGRVEQLNEHHAHSLVFLQDIRYYERMV